MIRRSALVLGILAIFGTAAHAQGYPQKERGEDVPVTHGGHSTRAGCAGWPASP